MKPYVLSLLLLGMSVLFITLAYEPNTKLYHITFKETDEPIHPLLDKMLDFLHRQGSDINILDYEDSELNRFYEFIHQPTLHQNDIVLVTRADTCVMVKSHKEIRKKFKLQQTPILFSGACNKTDTLEKERIDSFPILESSMFIGRVWALRVCFSGYQKDIEIDTNTFWKTSHVQTPNLIKIDTDSQLFLCADGIEKKNIHFDRFEGDIHYVNTDTHPYLVSAEDPAYLHTVVSRWRE